jgi:2-dehydro-3-deoxyphosphogluconate aldolase/(4S)-4-hydroxy-2-oxoglutarate aldolase
MEMTVVERIARAGVLPVIVIDDPHTSSDLADALVDGGLPVAEVTLRTAAGLQALRTFAQRSDLLVGAGTVLTERDVELCADAGARFIVSPGFDRVVVEHAMSLGLEAFPGIATSTEIQAALRSGLTTVKVFPAERLGGVDLLDAFGGPFPDLRFLPSGGITEDHLAEYLSRRSVAAVSGSWMASRAAISAQDFDGIREACARTVARVSEIRA